MTSSSARPEHEPVLVLLAIAVVVAVIGLVALVGVRRTSAEPVDAPTTATTSTGPTVPDIANDGSQDDFIRLVARPAGEEPPPTKVIDRLEAGTVLRLSVANLPANSAGVVHQCTHRGAGFVGCANGFPIQANSGGVAYLQYQLRGDAQRCGVTGSCVLVVAGDDDHVATAYTLFGAAQPPAAAIRVRPEGPYRPGTRVQVIAQPVLPGAAVDVVFCTSSCGSPSRVTADRFGVARASVVLTPSCRRGERCVIQATGLATRDAAVSVRFATGPGARYDTARVALGLAVAAILLLGVSVLARRTDWRAPTEAATPALDAASLTDET